MTSIVEVIQHYQRSIDNSQNNEARLLHCINKLHNLPIKVEHLQETGVGKTVNSLRKFNGEIGVAAKALVTKWKAMVAAEEEPMDTTSQTNESETHNGSNGDDEANTPHDDEADENHNRNINSQEQEEHKHRSKEKKDKHKDKHKDRSSSGHKEHSKHSSSSSKHSSDKSEKHKSSSSSSSKEKESHSSKHKDKEREKEKIEHKSNKDKHKDQDKDKEKERSDKKREEKEKSKSDKEHSISHKSSSSSSSSKSKHDDKHSSSGHCSSSSSKEKERSDKPKSSSKDKERSKEQEKYSSLSTSSSKDKPEHKSSSTSSTFKSSAKDSDSAERKRRHNSDNDSSDFKSPQPKVAKVVQKSTPASKLESSPPQADEDVVDDSFDSSMGANFDDVLGMLNVPLKKSKKSLKSPSTPTASSNSSSKKDRPSSSSCSSDTPLTSSSSGKVNGTRVPFSSNNSTSSLYSTPSSSKSGTMKPDLLAPTAKLEPLDPSIVLELPTISTNYKPMPLNQTVMDCVFNNSSSSSRPVRTLTDAEAITHGISSKTIRTKIYSGVRTGQTYQVPTLFDMCIRILQKNIDALEYTGGVPFEVLKPVLERATPQQLYVFEDYNPYLMEDSDVLWQQHVSRTYRTKKRLENESWREMFIRCQEEEERRLSELKDSIKASQKMAAAPVRKTQLAFVDSMVKPPRNVAKKQEQYGTKSKMIATPAARVAALSNVTPNAAKVGDQRLRVPSTARDHAQVSSSSIRPKKAPLMQKTLQFIRGRHKR